jgi:hypothetical protein
MNKRVDGEFDDSEGSSAEGEDKEESLDRHSLRNDSDDECLIVPSLDKSESSDDDEYNPDNPSYEDDGNSSSDVDNESVVNASITYSPSSTSLASAKSSVPKAPIRKSIRCCSSSSGVKQSFSSANSASFDTSVPKPAIQKSSTHSSSLHYRGKPSLSIAASESNNSFFPEATLPKSTRRKDKAKATIAMRQPSSIAKR